jgi:integrase
MSGRSRSVPTYRLHKQSGQAVVTLPDGLGGRRDVLLGKHGSPESRLEYARVIAEWEAGGRHRPAGVPQRHDLTVNELLLRFWHHAEQHYRHADGSPTSELTEYRYSLRPLRELYGHVAVGGFGPLALKAVRQRMVEAGWCRGVVNQRLGRIKRAFRWGVAEELVPVTVSQALDTLKGLPKGRSDARESEPVKPVPEAFVTAVVPHLGRHVRAMVELQRLTGMRPGEVCRVRPCDIDMTGPAWLYRPAGHKTAWRGKDRVIALGPRAQAIVREFLTARADDYLFSPRRARDERFAELRTARQTKVQPSQACRKKARPKKLPGERYSTLSYGHAIGRACERAGVPSWAPNRLRHNHATEIRRRFGLEAAQVSLGHSRADVTQVYAERDLGLALRIAAEVG